MKQINLRKTHDKNPRFRVTDKGIVLSLSFIFLYIISLYDYTLFHFIAETSTMVIGFCMIAICINTDATSENSFYTLLGIAYGFISLINIFHIAANSGMGILKNGTLNYAVQLRIVKIYMEAISLIIATFFVNKKINIRFTFYSYLLISIACIVSTYFLQVFPACYIEGVGLTKFKIISEYLVLLMLAVTQIILITKKRYFPARILRLLLISILLTQLSNLLSTMYLIKEDWPNIWAHIIKLFSFCVIYVAIIQTSFKNPIELFYKKLDDKNNQLLWLNEILQRNNSELMKSKEEIRRNHEQYQKLVESFPEAVCILKDEKIQYYNKMFCELLDIQSSNEALQSSIYDIVSFENPGLIKLKLGTVEEGVATPPVEQTLMKSSGASSTIEFSALSTRIEGETNVVIFMKDITQKKLAEELISKERIEQENEKIRVEFFSNISHELRTPINIIYSILQLKDSSKRNGVEVNLEKYFNTIKQNCFRLLRLTNNLIDITKIDSGYLNPQLRLENIVELVENITLSTVPYAESKGISVVFDTSDEEVFIACDPDLIERIILNLISNSVKYGRPDGEITVNVLRETNDVLIKIKDDGIGIPEDKKNQIFNRFMQVDRTFRRSSEGSGIGLSLAKSLVELQKGSIWFTSKEEIGTEFIIKFPVCSEELSETINPKLIEENNTINKVEVELSDIYYD